MEPEGFLTLNKTSRAYFAHNRHFINISSFEPRYILILKGKWWHATVTVSLRSSKMLRIFRLCQCYQLLPSQNAVKKACHPVEAVGQQHNIMIKCTVGFRLGSKRYRETDYICESGKITQQCLTSPSPLHLPPNSWRKSLPVDSLSPSLRRSPERPSPCWKCISGLPDFSKEEILRKGFMSCRTWGLYHK